MEAVWVFQVVYRAVMVHFLIPWAYQAALPAYLENMLLIKDLPFARTVKWGHT
jgi:hypothetical protein